MASTPNSITVNSGEFKRLTGAAPRSYHFGHAVEILTDLIRPFTTITDSTELKRTLIQIAPNSVPFDEKVVSTVSST